jgi:hypothetical protein
MTKKNSLTEIALKQPDGSEFGMREDGCLVIYRVTRSKYGVVQLSRIPTHVEIRYLDDSSFPAQVKHDMGGYSVLSGPRWFRIVDEKIRWKEAGSETIVPPTSDVSPQARDHRWQYLILNLKDQGKCGELWCRSSLPKGGKKMFASFCEARQRGLSEEEIYDALWAEHGEACNDLFRAVSIPQSTYRLPPDSLLVLFGVKRGGYTPLASFGPSPDDVNWTEAPL